LMHWPASAVKSRAAQSLSETALGAYINAL
jgi:hypothetical protein